MLIEIIMIIFSGRKFVSDRTAANMNSSGAASAGIKSSALVNEEVGIFFLNSYLYLNSKL